MGVDVLEQPHYPFAFIQADALELLAEGGAEGFDAIHASPPCQHYVELAAHERHWRSVPPTREALEATGLPWVIENVAAARWDLRFPVRLCGSTFGLGVRRHRLFEASFPLFVDPPCLHEEQGEIRAYYGKPGWIVWKRGGAQVQTADRKPLLRGSPELAAGDMGIDWMTWDELRDAIPPAYTEYVGAQLLGWLETRGTPSVREGVAAA